MASFSISSHTKSIIRRVLKGSACALGGISALLITIVVGMVLYARTDAGEHRLLSALEPVVNKALAPHGLNLSIENLDGPLPSRLALYGIRLSDAHGIWFFAKEASLEISWMALWGGTLHVSSIAFDRPELSRLPELIASPKPVEPEQAAPDFSTLLDLTKLWPQWLPALALDTLYIDDLVLEQAVAGQRLVLTLQGSAQASATEATASINVRNSMPTASAMENADLASIHVALTPEQTLNVNVALSNLFLPDLQEKWGFTPSFGGYLKGTGSLTDWKGEWLATLHDGGTAISSPENAQGNNAPLMAELLGNVEWTLDKALLPRLLFTADAHTAQSSQSLWELIGQNHGQAHAQLRLVLSSEDVHQATPSSRSANSHDEEKTPLNATLESVVQLTDMGWGTPALHAVFGPALTVQSRLNLALNSKGQADIALSQLHLQSGNFSFAGNATASAHLPASDNGTTLSWLAALLHSGDIAAKFSASLPDISAFAPGVTAKSPLTLELALSGPLHAPYASANITAATIFLDTTADSLTPAGTVPNQGADKQTTPGIRIDELNGQLEIPCVSLTTLWPPLAEFMPALIPSPQASLVSGTIHAQAKRVNREPHKNGSEAGEVGDISLSANFATGWELAGQLQFDLTHLEAHGGGVQATGNLGGLLPFRLPVSVAVGPPRPTNIAQSAPPLALQGELHAQIADWKKLSVLTGYAIEGTDVAAQVRLDSSKNAGQSLMAEWQAATLIVMPTRLSSSNTGAAPPRAKATPPSNPEALLSIKEWHGHASISGLEALFSMSPGASIGFEKVNLDIVNKTGRIMVSDALLAATSATISGPMHGPLRIKAAVQNRKEVRANQPPDPNRTPRVPKKTSDETPTLDQELEKLTQRLARNISGEFDAVWRLGLLDIAKLRLGTSSRSHPVSISLSAPTSIRYGISPDMPQGGLAIKRMELAVSPAGNIVLEGTLNPQTWKFNASISDLDLSLFQAMLTAMPSGKVNAQASLRGNMQRPAGELTLELDSILVPGSLMPPASVHITGKLENNARGSQISAVLSLPDKERKAFGVNEASATLSLPLRISANGLPMLASNQALKGNIVWRGALAPLWNFLPVADKRLLGEINLDVQASGTLQNPHIAINAAIRNAEYQDLGLGLLLKNIQATLDVQDSIRNTKSPTLLLHMQGLANVHASADDGMGGTLTLDGSVDFAAMSLSVKGALDNLKPLRRQDLRINLSGTASAMGKIMHPAVNANIIVNEGELTLENLPGGNIRTLPISNAPSLDSDSEQSPSLPEFGGMLQLKLQIPNRFFVRGHGLDSEWRGDFDIAGPLLTPSLSGSLNAVRGNLDFLGRNFKLSRGVVSFAGGTQINPMLDVIMTYQTSSINADIGISGLAMRPKLTLSSQPALPQDEILAQIMFGQSADKLGRLEALQLASAVASIANLSSGSGFGVLGTARKILGVDVLRLNSGQATSANSDDLGNTEVEVGKYLTDKVYVGVSQGISGDASTGVVVEIELSPHINAEARAGTTRTEVGVEWKYDY